MADKETAPETAGVTNTDEAPVAVKRPRKPRTPKVLEETITITPVEAEETVVVSKPKVTRTRKPKAVATPPEPLTTTVEDVAPVLAVELTVGEPLTVTADELTPEKPVVKATPSTDDESGGELTLESLFGPQEEDTKAEDKAAKELASREFADEAYAKAEEEAYYTNNGVVLTSGYWQAWSGKGGRINVFAWLGIFAAFVFFPFGLIFSGLGYVNAKAVPDDKFSRILSIVGLGVSVFFSFLVLIPLVFSALFSLVRLAWSPFM